MRLKDAKERAEKLQKMGSDLWVILKKQQWVLSKITIYLSNEDFSYGGT